MAGEGKKSKKAGRSAKRCQAYRSAGTQEVNKYCKLLRVLRRTPDDKCALARLKELKPYAAKAIKKMQAANFKGRLNYD